MELEIMNRYEKISDFRGELNFKGDLIFKAWPQTKN